MSGADTDGAGRAHLHALARWLQDAAAADAADSQVLIQSAWIVRRSTMRIERLPRIGERLELRTWCSGVAKSVAERRTSLEGNLGAAVEVEALWVHIDPGARRPARLPEAFHAVYGESAAGRRPRTSLRHPAAPPAGAASFDWRFARADLDIAGHVNNTMYWRLAEDHLDTAPLERGGGAVAEAEYRAGLGAGVASVERADGMLWVRDPEGSVAATLSIGTAAEGPDLSF